MNKNIYFDILSLAQKLDRYHDGFFKKDLHLFAYFSSILFNLKKQNWTYDFQVIDGYPYSKELNKFIDIFLNNGYFKDNRKYMNITVRGVNVFYDHKKNNLEREHVIDASCTASIIIPLNLTISSLLKDPSLLNKNIVYDDKLKELIKPFNFPENDLILPAVTWINYLKKL